MKVAIVHDDLVQWGGAERVLEGICEIFPEAPIFTAVFDRSNKALNKRFGEKRVYTSFLQKIPSWKSLYKQLFFLHPVAFEQFDFTGFDLVISHTTRFAKSIITKPGTVHICYTHTPPRFLWHFSGEHYSYISELFFSKMRIFDAVSAKRVDYFLAGSENAKKRIKKTYKMDSRVVHPFVDLARFSAKGGPASGWDGGYFLVISRLNKYKRVDLAIEACIELGLQLRVIGEGPELDRLLQLSSWRSEATIGSVDILGSIGRPRASLQNDGVEFLGNLPDEKVVQVLAGCKALILCGEEDFGLTPLEAAALGKPVIAFGKGGALETVIDGETGLFFREQTSGSLKEALERFSAKGVSASGWDIEKIQEHAQKFSKEKFIKNFKSAIEELL